MKIATNRTILTVASCLYLASTSAWDARAQLSVPENAQKSLARYLTDDIRVPDSPAAAVLGIAPGSVLHANTPPEFHSALLNAVDPYGNIQRGVALDINPFMLYEGDTFSLKDYADKPFSRQLANSTLSIAVTKGASDDDKASRGALGFQTSFLWYDPRLNRKLLECLDRDIGAAKKNLGFADPNTGMYSPAQRAQFDKDSLDVSKKCAEQNKPPMSGGVSLGFAPTWESQSAKLGGLDTQGYSAWASVSFGLPSDTGLLIFNAQRKTNQLAPDPQNSKNSIKQDMDIGTTGLRFKGPDWNNIKDIAMTGEAGYVRADRDGLSTDTYWQYLGQIEFKIPALAPDVIFDLSLGQTSGRDKDDTFGRFALRWKFNDKSKAVVSP